MIPFVDLKIQYLSIQNEVNKEIEEVLNQTNFILGNPVAEFEKNFAEFCDAKYCVGVASGTDALHLALHAQEIGHGDEVVIPANTFIATILAISYVGAKPVLVDIDPETYNIDLAKLKEKITSKTKAIIPVHLYGRPVDMTRLEEIGSEFNLQIIEDACQAHGATWNGKKVGSFGIMGCFSFYPGKNLGAYGDGGAIITSNEELFNKLIMLRNYGSSKKYYHDFIGFNSRLDTIQASVLGVKLKYLNDWNEKRFANAGLYNQKLKDVGDLILPNNDDVESHVFHLYVIRTKQRDQLMSYLNEKKIQVGIHYPIPIYSLGAYSHLGLTGSDYPTTECFSREILSLPMFPELSEDQIDIVTDTVKKYFKN